MGRSIRKEGGVLKNRTMTIRQRIMADLEGHILTARDLSQSVRISEKDVLDHLSHVAKSLQGPKRLVLFPSVCQHCGFVFESRKRFSCPSRCPECRQENVSPPAFKIESE